MNEPCYWILRCQHRLLTISGDAKESLFPLGLAANFGHPENVLPIGELHGRPCFAAEVEQFPVIPFGEATPLRAIFQLAGSETFALAARQQLMALQDPLQRLHLVCEYLREKQLI